jgi:hypothetical protein
MYLCKHGLTISAGKENRKMSFRWLVLIGKILIIFFEFQICGFDIKNRVSEIKLK